MTRDPAPRIDVEIVDRLQAIARSRPGFLLTLLESFAGNQRRFVAGLEQLISAADRERLRVGAHTLKGSAASLGATRLAMLAAELEALAPDADENRLVATATALRDELEAALEDLSKAYARIERGSDDPT